MRKQSTAILISLILIFSIQAAAFPVACAAEKGRLTQLIPDAETPVPETISPAEDNRVSEEGDTDNIIEVVLTPENWVDYFSVECFQNLEMNEIMVAQGTPFGVLTLRYCLVLRDQYRNRLVMGEKEELQVSCKFFECSGFFEVDYETGEFTDTGSYAAVRTLTAESSVLVSTPYRTDVGNQLTSSTVIITGDSGREFGRVYNGFEITSIIGKIWLAEEGYENTDENSTVSVTGKADVETLLDDGTLLVQVKDHSMQIELSGIEVKDSYVLDQTNSKKQWAEYHWEVNFSDGRNRYIVETFYFCKEPGLNRISSIDEMESWLAVGIQNGAMQLKEITMTHTDSSIHWSVEFPDEYDVDFSAIRSFSVIISDPANAIFQYDDHPIR